MAAPTKPGFLPGPYEILELADGEVKEFRVVRFVVGDMEIRPRYPGAPETKTIRGVRVFVAREDKPFGPDYYDVTASTLVYDLVPKLEAWTLWPAKIKITAKGSGFRKRFMVEVGPRVPVP